MPAAAAWKQGRQYAVHQLAPSLEVLCGDELGLSSSDPSEVTCARCAFLVVVDLVEQALTHRADGRPYVAS